MEDHQVPSEPYPHLNDSKELARFLARLRFVSKVWWPAVVVLALAVGYPIIKSRF
jgi:hypothetical protein